MEKLETVGIWALVIVTGVAGLACIAGMAYGAWLLA